MHLSLAEKAFFKLVKANTGAIAHFFFKVWKASSAAAVSENWMVLFNLLFPQPSRLFSGFNYSCEVLYEVVEVPYGSDKFSNSSIHHRGTHVCDLLNALLSRGAYPWLKSHGPSTISPP